MTSLVFKCDVVEGKNFSSKIGTRAAMTHDPESAILKIIIAADVHELRYCVDCWLLLPFSIDLSPSAF